MPRIILPAPDIVFKVAPLVVLLILIVAPLEILVDNEFAIAPDPDSARTPSLTVVAPV